MTLEARLRDVFVGTLELPPDVDPAAISYRSHPNWDSLRHMSLVVAMEQEFAVELSPDQIMELDSIDAGLKILRDAGASE